MYTILYRADMQHHGQTRYSTCTWASSASYVVYLEVEGRVLAITNAVILGQFGFIDLAMIG